MSNTKMMTCVFASNLLSNSPFTLGKQYLATRDPEGRIFLKCNIGMDIQIDYSISNTKGNWCYNSDDGYFGFNL